MKTLACSFLLTLTPLFAEGPYPVDPASVRQEGVPKGKVEKHDFRNSKVYPGTERTYWTYVPAQYDPAKPACLMVFQDGGSYVNEGGASKVPIVFDNLIAKGEMPVTIGLFVDPGVVPAANDQSQPRFNRSYEYDAFSGDYARFLIDELIPEVAKDFNLSDNPDHRAISGASSGAIAAFNVAWQRPDAFRRVYSMIGTFVGLRGGDEIPTMIRKTEPKPLRVFLQDGSNDNDIYCGDWWMANQAMERALVFSGYEVNHEWGEGQHSHQHGGAIMPKALRWLWKDFPQPVDVHYGACRSRAEEMLVPGENWQLVSEGHGFTEGPVPGPDGSVYFTDIPKNLIHRIAPDGGVSVFLENTRGTNGLAFGPDGRLYGCRTGSGEIVSWDIGTKEEKVHASGLKANDLVVAHDGTIYATEPDKKAVWIIRPGQDKVLGTDKCNGVNGIILTPDQSRVEIADPGGRYVWSAVRAKDGSLTHVQPYHHLHLPPADPDPRSRADGMAMTRDGWLLVATALGVQIFDQPGRVNLILPAPPGARFPSNLCFAGADMTTLYATAGDKIFKRKTKLTGVKAWEKPVMPPKPGL
ncbi:SMP-30/gluconolactonase/LRE family protein [Luteolibacter marinus]|uniref:SMP-30/gluconolactonase/LRE family protein n=1 Tax=Luteolibacter marinus TaxID=2776705 RepID=UPI001867C882|nr:SMP-30/gluconolactonase/LRE family protein [Luteolibacter marinus]